MKHYYSPHTGEHINTDSPQDWMSSTETAPSHTGMFFDGLQWYDFVSPVDNTKRISEIRNALLSIDMKSIRPAREGDVTRLNELEAQAIAFRLELATLSEAV
jgi:hypothetical protein